MLAIFVFTQTPMIKPKQEQSISERFALYVWRHCLSRVTIARDLFISVNERRGLSSTVRQRHKCTDF